MHMRRGGTAARASGATPSTYITICVYKLLRKHDRLAKNTADLSKILIKKKNQTTHPKHRNQTEHPTWLLDSVGQDRLRLVMWGGLQCPR